MAKVPGFITAASLAAALSGVSAEEVFADIGRVKDKSINFKDFQTKYPSLFDGTAAQLSKRKPDSLLGAARRAYTQGKRSGIKSVRDLAKKAEKGYKSPPAPPKPPKPPRLPLKKNYRRLREWIADKLPQLQGLDPWIFGKDVKTHVEGWDDIPKEVRDRIYEEVQEEWKKS